MLRVVLGCLASLLAAACIDGVEPLSFEVAMHGAPLTATTNDTITFVVDAQGNDLRLVAIDYADDSTEAFGTGGARTATILFKHRYQATGTFDVVATVTEGTAGQQKSATVQVTVQ